jgi:hypothetical protein
MPEIFEREDVSLYAIAGVPRAFKKKLQTIVEEEAPEDGVVLLVDDELAEWMLARLQDQKVPRGKKTPASQALWRAYSALSAARYYLKDETAEEERVRDLRDRVEALWREVSPLFEDEPEE